MQDQLGFVWVGTALGLNRYNGYDFKIYTTKTGNAPQLSSDAVYALHADKSGGVWVGTAQGLDRYEPDTDSFRHFDNAVQRSGTRVRAITSDSTGKIWAGTSDLVSGNLQIVRIDPSSGAARHFSFPALQKQEVIYLRCLDRSRVLFVARDSDGRVHPMGFSAHILHVDSGELENIPYIGDPVSPQGADERDITVAEAGAGQFWVGARGDRIYHLDTNACTITSFRYRPEMETAGSLLVSHVVGSPNGRVWIIPTWRDPARRLDRNTIFALDGINTELHLVDLQPAGACDLARSFVISSMIDAAGVLWAGLSGAGMCVADLESGMFSRLNESSPNIQLSSNFVRAAWKTPEGIMWVGTRSGLDRIDRAKGEVQRFTNESGVESSLAENEVTALLVDRAGGLWVGTQRHGLDYRRGGSNRFEHFGHIAADPKSLSGHHVTSLVQSSDGTVWATTLGGGLNRFNPAMRNFTSYRHDDAKSDSISSDFLTVVKEGSNGRLWVGSDRSGLNSFDPISGKSVFVDLKIANVPRISSLDLDPQDPRIIWIGTVGSGLVRFDSTSGTATQYLSNTSLLPSDTVFSIQADREGSVWAGTSRGLVRIDVRHLSFRIFGMDQGLQSMEFNTRASFVAEDGEVLMGGVGGLNAFYPREIRQNGFPPKVVLTQVRAFDPNRQTGSPLYKVVHRPGDTSERSTLPYASRDLIFDFVGLHFADPSRNSYWYKLDGFDKDWRDSGLSREVTYSNLTPGPYTFRVRAITSRGVESLHDATYQFTIDRPFYLNPWYWCLTAGLLIAGAYSIHRTRLQKLLVVQQAIESEVQQRTAQLTEAISIIERQSVQLRESDELKSRFITNVSHDFRTPLAVTLGTLADVTAGLHGPISQDASQHLEIVMRNERRLLRLVNQLYAIARLETGKLQLRIVKYDVAEAAEEVCSIFQALASRRQISIACEHNGPVMAYLDPEWMMEVIANLVINAVKFSPAGATVTVRILANPAADGIRLEVHDAGSGISPADMPRIFERYYQSDRGSTDSRAGIGVGLSLVKEIVELHGGTVEVRSIPGQGSCFCVLLKAGNAHVRPDQTADLPKPDSAGLYADVIAEEFDDLLPELQADGNGNSAGGERPVIVIAEDDAELRRYLLKHLQPHYQVFSAEAGDLALQKIRSETPDLVISDIRMPGLDGYQLCREMRSSQETDFIPILFLTAKSGLEDRLEGLNVGADDYIVKPFEIEELKAKIRNVLESRKTLRLRIASELALNGAKVQEKVPESADATFVRRLYEKLRERASDPEFSVELLAAELAMSRMHLYRRTVATLGKPPAEVQMEYRLERGAQLLAAKSGTVSEIAYQVGFKSVAHFTRRFRDRFQQTPSEYRAASNVQNGHR